MANVTPSTCVRFEQIGKQYAAGLLGLRKIPALDQITFDVFAGDVFGLIGPNRAGKTTLVKILLTICQPTTGRFTRLGRDGRDRGTLARVGYVHERQAFPRYLTGARLLEYYGTLSYVPPRELSSRIDHLLGYVGLAQWATSPISYYSKGMVQRLALAQALINDPDLLVLDEPSEGMDQGARKLIHDTVQRRQQSGRTTILISHAMSEVQRLCNRVAVLHAGRLSFCGTIDDLIESGLGSASERLNPFALERALEPLYAEALS